jgi:hypothetical protein
MKGAPIIDLTDSAGAILFGLAKEVGVISILPVLEDFAIGLVSTRLMVSFFEGSTS